MPLDSIGERYAAMLYQKRHEAILADQVQELQKVVEDFSKRNLLQSGMYLSARARVIGKHVGLMAEAMAQTLLQAYERAGQPLSQAVLQEITAKVNQFCEAKKPNLRMAASNLVSQNFQGQPPNAQRLVDALTGEMERGLNFASASAIRELTIKHHELLIDHGRAATAQATSMQATPAQATPAHATPAHATPAHATPAQATPATDQQWDVFISHASEDKESFVRALADALGETGLRVWFDATVLTVGDSLRGKIDEGLSRSRYGIVVLSPSFFAKSWPQQELDGLVSKEVSGIKVILPVWHNIDFDGVRARSPMLAGRLAARSSDGMEKVVSELRAAMGL
jgi:hypothetical protein